MRLHLYLARGGVASRRASEALIVAGRVTVNGIVITQLGSKVSPGDRVCVDRNPVPSSDGAERYIALHKPSGFVCTAKDPQGRRRAVELLSNDILSSERLFSVGRLDYNSTGLLLFTSDGCFAQHAAHPSYGVEKDYLVQAAGGAPIPEELLRRYRFGMLIDDEYYRLERYARQAADRVLLTLRTGKNREIRRVFTSAGIRLSRVHRVRIGPVCLEGLDSGHHRSLADDEVKWFLRLERQLSP